MQTKKKTKSSSLLHIVKKTIPFLILPLLAILLYLPTLNYDFVYLDDVVLIKKNIAFLKNTSNFIQAFNQSVFAQNGYNYGFFYRPVLILSFMLDAQFSDSSLSPFHISNIIYHIVASLLLFIFLRNLTRINHLSFLLSAIFAVHPANVMAVAWIPGRNEMILTIVILVSMFVMDKLAVFRKWYYFTIYFLISLFSIFIKEIAPIIPAVGLVYLLTILRKYISKKLVIFLIFSLIITSVLVFILHQTFTTESGLSPKVIVTNIFTNLPAIIISLGKIIMPFNLSTFPNLPDIKHTYGVISLLLLLIVIIKYHKNWNLIILGILWFVIFLMPTLIYKGNYSTLILFEHRAYLPFVGVLCIFAGLDIFKKSLSGYIKTIFTISVFVLIFSYLSYRHIAHFRDISTFWTNAVDTSPGSADAHLTLGSVYLNNGEYENAISEFKKSSELAPQLWGIHNYLGIVYQKQNKFDEAKNEFELELKYHPNHKETKKNLEE